MVDPGPPNWLYEFRQCVSSTEDALECAKLAASYNPHSQRLENVDLTERYHGDSSDSDTTDCSDVTLGTVSDVYMCGYSAFIKSRDVQLDLAKVYLLISKALKSSRGLQPNDNAVWHTKRYLTPLMSRFKSYVVICIKLSEAATFDDDTQDANEDTMSSFGGLRKPMRKTETHFKLDPAEYRTITDPSEHLHEGITSENGSNSMTMLSWPFYRDANCSDMFKLLCYTLMVGNFEAFSIILENHEPCIMKHIESHWSVLLSYIPICCDYAKCRNVVEKVFRLSNGCLEDSYIKLFDWIVWRLHIILKSTKCSFYLSYKYLKTMALLLCSGSTKSPAVVCRQHFLESLTAIMKQHMIINNYKTSYATGVQELESSKHIPLTEYLQLRASEKLQLFCDCIDIPSAKNVDCSCDEVYKDKYGIYPSCLYCKTLDGVVTLSKFFRWIKTVRCDIDLTNQYCDYNTEFARFFDSIKHCAYASIDDYMENIYSTLDECANSGIFETIYVLTKSIIGTQLRNRAQTIVFRVLFSRRFSYNMLGNYFMYKSIYMLIEDLTEDGELDITDLGDSHLNALCTGYTPSDKHHQNPKYAHFLKSWEKANGKLTYQLVRDVITCELNFAESLLNIFSLVQLPLGNKIFYVDVGEITNALYDSDTALMLMQRILVYIMDHQLTIEDFRNALYSLTDVVSYINDVSIQEVYTMFFYTIATSCNHVGYLEALCDVWFASHNKGIAGIGLFLREALLAAKATVYLLSNQHYVNPTLMRMVTDIMHNIHVSLPDRLCFKHRVHGNSMDIHDVIGTFLDFLGIDWDGQSLDKGMNILSMLDNANNSNYIPDQDVIIADIKTLGLLQRMSTVLIDLDCDMNSLETRLGTLCNSLYHCKTRIVQDAFGNLASILITKADAAVPNSEAYWEFTIFAAILCTSVPQDIEPSDNDAKDLGHVIQLIKTSGTIVLPKHLRQGVSEILEVLRCLVHDGQHHEKIEHVPEDPELSTLLYRLFGTSCVNAGDYVGLSKVMDQASPSDIPKLASFLKEAVFNLPDKLDRSTVDLEDSQVSLFEVLTGPDTDTGVEPISSYPDLKVDDLSMRSAILKLLSRVNLTKVEVCQQDKMKISFDTLAHHFTGNSASGLLSKAFGKAETGLSSINIKKMQFESLKGKFFALSKRNMDAFNVCFLPLLNYYSTGVICHTNYVLEDPEHLEMDASPRGAIKWPTYSQTELLQLLRGHTQLGVMMLLENCNFKPNMLFIEQMHRIFHNFNVHQCLRVLAEVIPTLVKFSWPSYLISHLETVVQFLEQFRTFPLDADIYIGRFVASAKYRMELFSQISTYLLDNVDDVLHIYRCLDNLFSCKQLVTRREITRIECITEELTGSIWHNNPPVTQGFGIEDTLLMQEYVHVLIRSLEKNIWEANPNELASKVKGVEPDFLNLGDQYRDSLIAMYSVYVQKRMHKPVHWLLWRKLVCRYLHVYPNDIELFNELYMPESEDMINLLEVLLRTTDGFDITEVDRFDTFKRRLTRKINVRNYYEIASYMRHVDPMAAKEIIESVHGMIKIPDKTLGFDATRQLYELDIKSTSQW
ncbi:uncharacterized protein BBOV_IV001720 [Babesia bovis T2Bo]|uniref:Uncharacterized protein n=1 Tax=Babesia bovis TaxID=5865 RepID=A7AVE3_BABBO|nr:uncharacterized protein BBOV_IV001720 [Babesia bovis T2Bo]EDO05769.1 hypothetical protein BBOV_IV001720 [Babesia bovis T2Bo]|eukprot:XP_001609337.1 hypothetical protein [Babesia bovis T2Bo]